MNVRRGRAPDRSGTKPVERLLDRRRFLIVVGGAAAYTALRSHEAWAKKAAQPLPPLQPWSLPPHPPANPIELGRALVGAAVLAPSNWNTQPWRLEVTGASLRLLADPRRALPVTDPDRREMHLSLGAALENLLVALRAYGLRPNVTYFPAGEREETVAQVAWSQADQRRDRDLFAAIPERRTNRREYDGRGIFMENRAALIALIPEDLRLHWMDGEGIRRLADLLHDATRAQILDRRGQAERWEWTRFGDDDARRSGDGVTVDALELGGPARWLARRYFHPRSRFLGLGAGSAAKQAREAMRSAGAAALLTVRRGDESSWLVAGQAYERFALRATRLGIAHHPMNAPLALAAYRGDLLRLFGVVGEQPLMLLRLGHAKPPKHSVRRGVSLVASLNS